MKDLGKKKNWYSILSEEQKEVVRKKMREFYAQKKAARIETTDLIDRKGGPRDMRKRYMDAMALVQRFGKPDIFLTMTCNPNWLEIKRELQPLEESQNRPDLISRVFKAKLEQFKIDLFKTEIFGPIAGYVYVIEFQKRGLPHAQSLVILKSSSKIIASETFDSIVTAELPDSKKNIHLYSAVIKHMMHGPCGHLNPNNVCMKKMENVKIIILKHFLKKQLNKRIRIQSIDDAKMVKKLK
ncbi:hypothetical protein Dsin_021523 [Dipteronia sinensis]|uniref:Helitron helicase-like domain-containing protein n=1 Tax=Dipteronia sinensis TaxID=43782 RepID=A0AAD9ZZY6_9ROSI|nr:hypothetical protein Dsin_021523 [Dipteronia sinensis]